MPANAVTFFSLVIDLMNFDLLPKDTASLEVAEPFNERFSRLGYKSVLSRDNLGSMLYINVGIIILTAVAIKLKLVLDKTKFVGKVNAKIAQKVQYNLIMRSVM